MSINTIYSNEDDIKKLKDKRHISLILQITISTFVCGVLFFSYLFASNNFFIFVVIGSVFFFPILYVFLLKQDLDLINDIKEKKKYSGTVKVAHKFVSDENNIYYIVFDNAAITPYTTEKDEWDTILVDDIFIVEQAINSGFKFRLEKITL